MQIFISADPLPFWCSVLSLDSWQFLNLLARTVPTIPIPCFIKVVATLCTNYRWTTWTIGAVEYAEANALQYSQRPEDPAGQGKYQLYQYVLQGWKWDLPDLLRHTICNPISLVFVSCTVSALIYLCRTPFACWYTKFLLVQWFGSIPLLHWLVVEFWTAYQDNPLVFAYYCSNVTIVFICSNRLVGITSANLS